MSLRQNPFRYPLLLLLVLVLGGVACSKQEQSSSTARASAEVKPASATLEPPAAQVSSTAPQLPPAKETFSGARAMQFNREVAAIGSRKVGSSGHAKVEQYIKSKLKGIEVEEDKFTAKTPVGSFPINNIVAKFPGEKDGIIVIAGHYDTNYPLPKEYVGANDGGSSTALLLELAEQLRGKPNNGYSIWLVWTDGEEAFVSWTAEDSVYGTKHLASKWQQDGTAKKIKAFILVDMIGDADLDVQKEMHSTPWLSDLVYQAASDLGYQSHFFKTQAPIEDDHLPLLAIGVPSVDIIDLDYGYNNVFHHTTQDTIDKVSAESLGISGNVVLRTIQLLNTR